MAQVDIPKFDKDEEIGAEGHEGLKAGIPLYEALDDIHEISDRNPKYRDWEKYLDLLEAVMSREDSFFDKGGAGGCVSFWWKWCLYKGCKTKTF